MSMNLSPQRLQLGAHGINDKAHTGIKMRIIAFLHPDFHSRHDPFNGPPFSQILCGLML